MKIVHSLKMFAGSVAVYVAVATAYACGEANRPTKPEYAATATSGGASGTFGTSATGGENSTSESVGAGPVPPAMADPVPGTRLQSTYRVAEDGSRQWHGWHDTELGLDCEWHRMSDGRTRCMPVDFWTYGEVYADAACSVRVALSYCTTDVNARFAHEYGGCDLTYRVYNLGDLQEGTQLYQVSGGSCSPVDGRTSTVYDRKILGEADPATFVASDIVRGP